MKKTMPTIAATSTLAMVQTATARGYQVADLLHSAGLTSATLEDPDTRLPAPVVTNLWNALCERTGDPALQLDAPSTLPFGAYRVIDYLVASSATVGDGVRRFAQFFKLIADSLTLEIHDSHGEHCAHLTSVSAAPVPSIYVDYVFAALVSRIRMRIRPGLVVSRVELRLAEPVWAARYYELFRAPVHFGAPSDRLYFSAVEWNALTDHGDSALAGLIEEHATILAQRTPRVPAGFTSEVRNAIIATLPRGASVQQVAHALHLSVRSLQRKLLECDTTFREISETTLGQLAEGYLTDPGVSISEVTVLLGFSEQSAFNRAFRRWTGMSPGQWRKSITTTKRLPR